MRRILVIFVAIAEAVCSFVVAMAAASVLGAWVFIPVVLWLLYGGALLIERLLPWPEERKAL